MKEEPKRCIDPVVKYCQECPLGWVKYPDWVETREDLCDCSFESGYCYGFENDEPTEEEIREFNERWENAHKK